MLSLSRNLRKQCEKTLLLKWAKVRTIPLCYKYYIMATQNDLTRSDIVKISIDHINHLRLVRLHGLRLENIDLEGLDLHGFIFTNCKLAGASFRNCKLNNATFTGADLTDCDFTDATGLSQGMFEGATIDGVLHNMSNVSF